MRRTLYLLLLPFLLALYGCDTSSTGSDIFDEASEEKQFVWNGLNFWYFWQSSVPDLADNRFSDDEAFHQFLNGFSDEETLFDNLLFNQDDFSWFIRDYIEHEQSRQGISRSFGFRYGLVRISSDSNLLFGYVQYVVPNSPADEAGLKRGDIFNRVNGTQLTLTNNSYLSVLQSDTYTLTLAEIENGAFNELGETDPIQSVVLQENPVFRDTVIETETATVGYLVYNAFRFNFHNELNEAFARFQSANVDELVLDLRYNSGGTLLTAAMLAGMISGMNDENVFARLIYNDKQSERNTTYPIFDEVPLYDGDGNFDRWVSMNQLNLNRLYVITGNWTASASETLMNGLMPYMEVIQIGSTTRGKDEGSITVYDSPPNYNNRDNANPNHMRAMQPIVFKIFNDLEQDYPQGFEPSPENEIYEYRSPYIQNMRPLGDPEEPVLARALQIITGVEPVAKMAIVEDQFGEMIFDSSQLVPFSDDVYLLPAEVEELGLMNDL